MILDWLHGERNKTWSVVVLGAIIFTFVLWGGYGKEGSRSSGQIKIGELGIDAQEFYQEYEYQREYFQQQFGNQPLNEQMDEYIKRMTLNRMLTREMLLKEAEILRIPCGSDEVAKLIRESGGFKDPATGNFNKKTYLSFLERRRMTPKGYESRIRNDILIEKLRMMLKIPLLVIPTDAQKFYDLEHTTVDLDYVIVDPTKDLLNVRVPETSLRADYEKNKNDYMREERRKVAYLELTPDIFKKSVAVSDEEAQSRYKKEIEEANAEQKKQYSEKRAWVEHILIEVKAPKKEADRAQAKKKALEILTEVKKDPSRFSELARQYSQDPSAVQNGGDMGYFPYSQMVKPFSDAVFAAKAGTVIGPVETNFGFHIIKVNDVSVEEGLSYQKFANEMKRAIAERKQADFRKAALANLEKAIGVLKQSKMDAREVLAKAGQSIGAGAKESASVTRDGVIPGVMDSFVVVQEAFRLKENEVSNILKQGDRAYVVGVTGIEKPTLMTFEEARPMIEKKLRKDVLELELKKIIKTANSKGQTADSLAATYKLKKENTGNFKKYGEKSIAKIGSADVLIDAVAAIQEGKRFYEQPVWYQNQFYLLYPKALKLPDPADWAKKSKEQIKMVEEQLQMSALMALSKELEIRYKATPEAISKVHL